MVSRLQCGSGSAVVAVSIAVLAAGALPSAARAATVSQVDVDSCLGDVGCGKYAAGEWVPVTMLSTSGEVNRVTVSRDGGEFVFRDTGARIQAFAPCRVVGAHTARCPVVPHEYDPPAEAYPAIARLNVLLGDGDDKATVAGDLGVTAHLAGGRGDDRLIGGGENDTIVGGLGDDRLAGRGGVDTLTYSDPWATWDTRPESAERTLFASARRARITVDLAAGTGGARGERDRVSGFEALVGGDGGDRLAGSRADDSIDGGPGNDVIVGADGRDTLIGNLGADRLDGRSGSDRLFGDPPQGDGTYTPVIRLRDDTLIGGPGGDELYDTGGRNVLQGGPGDDLLRGGVDRDRLEGGRGNDRLDGFDTFPWRGEVSWPPDRILCGAGLDQARADGEDSRRSCEQSWDGINDPPYPGFPDAQATMSSR